MLQGLYENDESVVPSQTGAENSFHNGADLILGYPSNKNLLALHPHPVLIFRLWQTYLDNVNPLVKVVHTPTVQKAILEASGDLANVSKGLETLMFAIYSLAILSLSDESCEKLMGEKRSVIQARYTFASRQSLINVEFLKSTELIVLQALVLFLVSHRDSVPRDPTLM